MVGPVGGLVKLREATSRSVATISRLYPFYSGAGTFANSWLFRQLDPASGRDSVVEVTGGRASIPAGDLVGRAMRFAGDLDPKVSWVIERCVGRGDIVLDIGCNLGLVALRLAERVGPGGQVHAFEPQPRMLKHLDETLALNPGLPVTLHRVALGAKAGELELSLPTGNAGAARLLASGDAGQGQSLSTVPVPVRRLDDVVHELGLSRLDFIKMDVEGFEAQVLEGARHVFKVLTPKVILLEENTSATGKHLPPALAFLAAAGYDLFGLPRRYLSMGLVPIAADVPAHDYVALAPGTQPEMRRALGL
ncbi:MAG: FkbM family methyltransferase [Pseudomonadota bacterium]